MTLDSNQNFDELPTGTPGDAISTNAPLRQISAKLGNLTGLTTAATTSMVAAVNSIVTALGVIGAAGWATTTRIADLAVTAAKLAADAVTTVKIADRNVTAAKLDTGVTAPGSIVWDVKNLVVPVGTDFKGRSRWYQSANLSMTDAVTSGNIYGNQSLTLAGVAAAQGGKKVYVDELGLQVGDIVRFAIIAKGATGTVSLGARCFDSSDTALGGAPVSTSQAMSGAVVYVPTADVTILATTSYIDVFLTQVSGIPAPLYIHALWGARGQYLSVYPPADNGYPDPLQGDNAMWDALNHEYYPGMDFGGRSRWHQPSGFSSVLYPDSTSPYNAPVLIIDATAGQPGKKLYLRDAGLQVGESVSFAATVASVGGTSVALRCGFWTAAGALISSVVTSTTVLTGTPVTLTTKLAKIPVTTEYILATTDRSGVGAPGKLYALWGGRNGATALPAASPLTAGLIAGEAARNLAVLGCADLKQWRFKAAALFSAVASTKAVLNLWGDSHVQRDIIRNPLTDYLVSLYGDAGSGYIGAVFGDQYAYNWTATRTGPWSVLTAGIGPNDVDIDTDATAKGPDGTHSYLKSTSDVWTVTATVTAFVLHYRNQIGGGDFTVQIDSGTVTPFTTDTTVGYVAFPFSAGSLGSHTITIRCTNPGSQGVLICGVEALKDQNGFRCNKLGNGGSTTTSHVSANATDIQAAMTALGGDVNVILLGTNDRAQSIPPSTYAGNLLVMIDRLRTAMPLADILLVAPCDTSPASSTFFGGAYAAAMRHVCTLRPHVAFVSLYDTMSPYADSVSRGLMADTLHPNTLGGVVSAHLLADVLRVR